MKRKYLIALMTLLSIGIAGCNQQEQIEDKPLTIATLNGPTGMGIINLIEEEELYDITLYQSPDEIVGKIVNQEIDIATVPSNMAALLYNKTKGTEAEVNLLGINTLGVLYVVENGDSIASVDDLKGKTILIGGKGTTPELILNQVISLSGMDITEDVNIEYLSNHADIASQLVAEPGVVALLPEPFVTTVMSKDSDITLGLDINSLWEELTDLELPMGTVIVNKNTLENQEEQINQFIEDYAASIDYVNENNPQAAEKIASYKIIPNSELAEEAIPKSNIVWISGEEAKTSLEALYEVFYSQEPKSIGGQLPDEVFYTME